MEDKLKGPLPQLTRRVLTDGGLETDLLFNRGIDLPWFAAVTLLGTVEGRAALETYYRPYLELARSLGTGFILESATWRASPDWAGPLGLQQAELDRLNRAAVELLLRLRTEFATDTSEIVVSGCVGPRGDGYDPGRIMGVSEAADYHGHQARVLASAGVDMLSALTMTNINEATGVALAAAEVGLPVAVSFTVETDGRLPMGDSLMDAMAAVDEATGGYPAYFMINCAHPDHFAAVLTIRQSRPGGGCFRCTRTPRMVRPSTTTGRGWGKPRSPARRTLPLRPVDVKSEWFHPVVFRS